LNVERLFLIAMIILASSAAARAQANSDVQVSSQIQGSSELNGQMNAQANPSTSAQVNAGTKTQASPGGTGTKLCWTSNSLASSGPTTLACGFDPLSVPTATIGAGAGSSQLGGSASANPQAPRQLPGEASNTSSQVPSTTTSLPAAASTTLCSPAITSAAGTSSPADLFGGASLNGC
jgi:hypothetical protein